MMEEKWVICPICSSKTRVKLRSDTVLKNFPLFCPKCKQESLINAESMKVNVVKEAADQ
ncbi:MAG: cysteine-rich KTR domain-containing protein [Oscillospiraceae bacterium]